MRRLALACGSAGLRLHVLAGCRRRAHVTNPDSWRPVGERMPQAAARILRPGAGVDVGDMKAGFAKALAALLALPAVVLVVLLAVNRADEAPSADAERLAAMLRERRGLGGAATGPGAARDFGARHPRYRDARVPPVAALARACSDARGCAAALEADASALGEWIAAERWLLDRYHAMLATKGWREEIPADVADALPPYGA